MPPRCGDQRKRGLDDLGWGRSYGAWRLALDAWRLIILSNVFAIIKLIVESPVSNLARLHDGNRL